MELLFNYMIKDVTCIAKKWSNNTQRHKEQHLWERRKKEKHGGKEEQQQGKNKPKNAKNKMGHELKVGSLYKPSDLGLEAAITSKTLFTFFPSN